MITREFKLKDFDGPLDLLLTLIGKAEIDIKDIFVSEITDQYLEIVRNATDLNMDEASDFLVMAATLLEIKSRSMLPKVRASVDFVEAGRNRTAIITSLNQAAAALQGKAGTRIS